jgi:hypothetical protein
VGNHDTPTSILGVLSSLDRLGKGTDLVDLEKKGIASVLLDGSSNTLGVSDSQVITNKLELRGGAEVGPVVPVILVESILNGNDWKRKKKFASQNNEWPQSKR